MRISYNLVLELANSGDMDAKRILKEWNSLENPFKDSKVEVYFIGSSEKKECPFLLLNPEKAPVFRSKMPTLMGIQIISGKYSQVCPTINQ